MTLPGPVVMQVHAPTLERYRDRKTSESRARLAKDEFKLLGVKGSPLFGLLSYFKYDCSLSPARCLPRVPGV